MPRRAFTLLEMLIALTILASITAGIGVFWAQANAWERDNGAHRETLRLERVTRMLREQWNGRRALALEDDGDAGGDGVRVNAGGVSFTTSRAVLFPSWGLVRVRYVIERDPAGGVDGTAYRLVYEEMRVLDASAPGAVGVDGTDPRGRPVGAREVLLDGLTALRMERWGTKDGEAVNAINDEPVPMIDGVPVVDDDDIDPSMVEAWRSFEVEPESPARVVRLVGEMPAGQGGEVFACVLIVAPSR